MDFDEFQKRAMACAKYPDMGDNFAYAVLGLCGESGEVAEKLKKIIRDKNGKMDLEDRRLLLKELGDILWYVTAAAIELKSSLDEVAVMGVEKVEGRKERGTLGGSGDDR